MASEVAECHVKPTTPGKLSLEDVMCPICLSILIEPVTMPCRHSLCMPCFNQHVAHSALACPICRRRINVWVRRAAIAKRLVNTRLWQNIQDSFAAKVDARIHGLDDSDSEEINVRVHHVSAPGEIRQEYESLLAQQHQDETIRKTEEELASSKLVQELQETEKMRLRERRKQQELLAENDTVVAQHIKEAEHKEQHKQMKKVGRGNLGTNSNKSATLPRGPMDVYIGQKTPRFYGKLIVPEVPCSSSDSSFISDKVKTTAMTSQDFNTPTTSMSRSGNCSTSSSKLDTMCIVSNCSSESLDYRVGRELREITSSQSSESESDDLVSPLQTSNHRRPITSGKENIQERRKNSPCKLGKGTFIASRKNHYDQNSPDIDSYNGVPVIGVAGNCIRISKKIENSEEMDIEEFICGQSPTKTKGSKNVKVTKCLVNGNLNSKSNVCEADGSDDEQIVTVSEVSDIPDCNQSSELIIQTDLTSIFCGQEGSSESLESFIAEQRQLEARLEQEVKDRLLAESLQKQFDQQRRVVNRSRGSEDEYKFRQRKNASSTSHKVPSISAGNSSQKKGRQPTLMESIAKRHRTA